MKRNLVVAAAAVLGVIVLAGVATYAYFFSGLRTSPASLGLSTPAVTSSPTAGTSLAASWKVTTGSIAGYRVQELFAGETSKHLAVARTSDVTGGMTVSGGFGGYQVSGINLTADLTSLRSVDQVAGRNVSQRDGIVSRQLEIQQIPYATFSASTASVPGSVTSTPADVTLLGRLTIHGVTKDVTVTAHAQVIGDKIEIAGTMTINMADYGVSPPRAPFVTVDPTATIEFDVFLARSSI
jgi:polyisoprenoid-binding protein YceI